MRFQTLLPTFLVLLDIASAGTPFRLLALTKTGTSINLKPVNANNGQFWIGKPTKSSCNLTNKKKCPPGNETVMDIPFANMGMYVGGLKQEAYIDKATGILHFTHPFAGQTSSDAPIVPPNSITTLREVTWSKNSMDDVLTWGGNLNVMTSGNNNWFACPPSGKSAGPPWSIKAPVAGVTIPSDCRKIWLVLAYWFDAGWAAQQYV